MTTVDQSSVQATGTKALRVKVVDRKEKELVNFQDKFDFDKMTVGDFIKIVQKESKSTCKCLKHHVKHFQ